MFLLQIDRRAGQDNQSCQPDSGISRKISHTPLLIRPQIRQRDVLVIQIAQILSTVQRHILIRHINIAAYRCICPRVRSSRLCSGSTGSGVRSCARSGSGSSRRKAAVSILFFPSS